MSAANSSAEARESGLTIAVVGVGSFGMTFVPIYQSHPDVARVIVCDPDAERLEKVAELFGVRETLPDLASVLGRPDIDAVHLITPMQLHADQSIAVLNAGKHCACAVPAGVTLGELHELVAAQRRSARNYMMMETAVYTREFLYAADLLERGELGRVQFLRGAHHSDYEGWPSWKWYPAMSYATHVVAPLFKLAGTRASSVRCLGSGRIPASLAGPMRNPYPVESALFELHESDVAVEVTRSIFRTARQVQESFSVYGEDASFEWPQLAGELPVLHRASRGHSSEGYPAFHRAVEELARTLGVDPSRYAELMPVPRFPPIVTERPSMPDFEKSLPGPLQRFAGHGGAEGHLVHEFVRSIAEKRAPSIDAVVATDWSAPGICAHESALAGGKSVPVLSFGSSF